MMKSFAYRYTVDERGLCFEPVAGLLTIVRFTASSLPAQ